MVPRALRSSDRTITIRVKDVTMIRIAGARDSTVINRKICSVTVGAIVWAAFSSPMVKKGVTTLGSAAKLLLGARQTNQAPRVIAKYHILRRLRRADTGEMLGRSRSCSGKNRSNIFM